MSTTREAEEWRREVISVIIDGVTLAERMRQAREAAGLTQQQVADACGISMQGVSHWETGKSKEMTGPHLFCVADVLGVSARWLATGEGDPGKDDFAVEFDQLPDDARRIVADLIRRLKPV